MPIAFYAILLVCALTALAAVEIYSLRRWNGRAVLRCELDMRLTEPGEVVTLRYRINNTGRWPLPSVSAAFYFSDSVELLDGDEENRKRNCFYVDTALLPHRVCRGTIRICFRERGRHDLGRVYLETGDFLGLRPVMRSFDIPLSVVCTAKSVDEQPDIRPLGGFLGDVSVRRFILDDPSIVLGYREYSGSEPLKDISWTQTARTGKLMVKQHDFTVDADVAVLVDTEDVEDGQREYCLSLVRTVCDELERKRIPYAVLSNGDLHFREKGVGRGHCFEIQRRIGLCRFIRYWSFRRLAADCAAAPGWKGYIIVAPRFSDELGEGVRWLRDRTGMQVCVLTGKEEPEHA